MKGFKYILTLLLMTVSFQAAAVPIANWSVSGPGTTDVEQIANVADISYSLNPAGFSDVSWAVTAVAGEAGDYTFDWNYSGFHAFFQVTAFLSSSLGDTLVNAGPQNCCSSPSAGFNFDGTYTFTGLNAGDTFGFTFGGSNVDRNNVLRGNLNLVQHVATPEPASIAILAMALLGLSFAKRRQV